MTNAKRKECPSARAPDIAADAGMMKSTGRVFSILEFFDNVRRPATASKIARHFGFPASSTSQLSRYMIIAGYLVIDQSPRGCSPSMRVSLLGNGWNRDHVGMGPSFL
ncbi:helix-turn-helix domain-containing protein [Pacificimonas sp. ICDLI1SI03]